MSQGTFVRVDGRPAVRFERRYAHPLERVWRAVTDPLEMRTWFPSTVTFEPVVGGAVTFSGDPNVAEQHGTVIAYDPPRLFSFTWGDNEIHVSLESDGENACRFILTNVLAAENESARNAAGWDVCLGELDKLLTGEDPAGPHSGLAADWQISYDAYVTAGMPSGARIPGRASS